jgi:hypothetical protein
MEIGGVEWRGKSENAGKMDLAQIFLDFGAGLQSFVKALVKFCQSSDRVQRFFSLHQLHSDSQLQKHPSKASI